MYLGVPDTAELTLCKGVLLLRTASLDPSLHLVLRPQSKRLAFSYGPTPNQTMRDAGYALEVRDGSLWWQGLRLVPIPNARGVGTSRD